MVCAVAMRCFARCAQFPSSQKNMTNFVLRHVIRSLEYFFRCCCCFIRAEFMFLLSLALWLFVRRKVIGFDFCSFFLVVCFCFCVRASRVHRMHVWEVNCSMPSFSHMPCPLLIPHRSQKSSQMTYENRILFSFLSCVCSFGFFSFLFVQQTEALSRKSLGNFICIMCFEQDAQITERKKEIEEVKRQRTRSKRVEQWQRSCRTTKKTALMRVLAAGIQSAQPQPISAGTNRAMAAFVLA